MRELTLEQAAGQVICPTLLHPRRGYDEAAWLASQARHGWGGYVVFHAGREELATRLATLHAASALPLLVAADMEHGAGQQVAGLSTFPPAMAFGAADDETLAEELGAWTAVEALKAGVNWIFAPVADVTNNPANPIISVRGFGGRPADVARLVAAFVRGVQAHGALACAKHFPGHGDTETDSHTRLGAVPADRARLEAVELPPFRAAIEADVASIMTAHLALPALGVHGPATLDPAVMTGLLRGELGFTGLTVTDALVMGGITRTTDPLEAAVRAVAAGCDVLLMPPDPEAAHAALLDAVAGGRLSDSRLREAAGRVLAAKARLKAPGQPPSRGPLDLAAAVSRRAVTLVDGTPHLPPDTLAVAVDDGIEGDRLLAWRESLAQHGVPMGPVVGVDTPDAVWEALERAPALLVALFSPVRVSKDRSLLPAALVARLRHLAARRPVTLVSCGSPFLLAQVPEARARLATYGSRDFQLDALLAALTTGGPYPGRLPVELPDALEAPAGTGEGSTSGPSFS